jgi:hypothetical protein
MYPPPPHMTHVSSSSSYDTCILLLIIRHMLCALCPCTPGQPGFEPLKKKKVCVCMWVCGCVGLCSLCVGGASPQHAPICLHTCVCVCVCVRVYSVSLCHPSLCSPPSLPPSPSLHLLPSLSLAPSRSLSPSLSLPRSLSLPLTPSLSLPLSLWCGQCWSDRGAQ